MILYLIAFLFASLAALFIGLARRPSVPYPDEYPDCVVTEGPVNEDGEIPKIIWSYWHDRTMPLLVERTIANWRRLNPGYEIRVLHAETVTDHIPAEDIPPNFPDLPQYRQADWVRIALLRRYGGIWLDASLFLTRSLDWIHECQQRTGAGYVSFYIEKPSTSRERPVVENWFMSAVPGHPFAEDLYREFTHEVLSGGERAYLQRLREHGEYEASVQKITGPEYLAMHVAASRLMLHKPYRLCLLKAEESAFFHPALFDWRNTPLYLNLAVYRAPERLPAVIKLRGGERRYFDRRLRIGLYSRNSIVGRYVMCRG